MKTTLRTDWVDGEMFTAAVVNAICAAINAVTAIDGGTP
jgi:hypothetical protein